MDYKIFTLPLLFTILSNFTTALPLNQEDTEAVYVPYDVKYIPVEVPEEFLEVQPLNSKNPSDMDQIVLKKDDVLEHFNTGTHNVIQPVKSDHSDDDNSLITVPLSTITQGLETSQNIEKEPTQKLTNNYKDIIVVPLSAISNQPNIEANPGEDLVVLPLEGKSKRSVINDFDTPLHKIAKRQAQRQRQRFRPFFRITGVSANRQRFGSSRRPALVGYMSDRDYFPTVA